MPDLNAQILKDKIVEILREGYFTASEERFNGGNLKQAFSYASTDDRWFKIKFQNHNDSREFVIDVGFVPDMEPVGHIGFNLDENCKLKSTEANFGIDKEEWLGQLLNAKYNPTMTDEFRREFETLPQDLIYQWEVTQRRYI